MQGVAAVLFFTIPTQHLPRLWIDNVNPRAGDAAHGLERMVILRIVSDEALHSEVSVGATKDETGHRANNGVPDGCALRWIKRGRQ